MNVSNILVISVVDFTQIGVVFSTIFSQSMKVSSILAMNVIMKLQNRVIFRNIFGLNMKVSSTLEVGVIFTAPHSGDIQTHKKTHDLT